MAFPIIALAMLSIQALLAILTLHLVQHSIRATVFAFSIFILFSYGMLVLSDHLGI